MAHITTGNWISNEEKRVETYTELLNKDSKTSIASAKWIEMLSEMKTAENGRIQIAKAFNDKPARTIQWIKTDSEVTFETYNSNSEGKWDFQHEFIVTIEQLEAFVPIHEYSMSIMNSLKKEFSDEAISDTTFLTRK